MLAELRCNLRCNLISYTVPSKQQGKVKTAAEPDKHNHYKHACESSFLSLTVHRTHTHHARHGGKRESHNLLPWWCFCCFLLPKCILGAEQGVTESCWPAGSVLGGVCVRLKWAWQRIRVEGALSGLRPWFPLCHALWNPVLAFRLW